MNEEEFRKDLEEWYSDITDPIRKEKLIEVQLAARFSRPIAPETIEYLQSFGPFDYSDEVIPDDESFIWLGERGKFE
jgi:hypothetical protein